MTQTNMRGRHVIHVCALAQVMVHFKLPLLRALDDMGVRQTIYCSDIQYNKNRSDAYVEGGDVHYLRSLGLDVHIGPLTRRPGVLTPYCIGVLTKYLQSVTPDMVMGHQPMGSLVAIISACRARVPAKVYFSGALKRVTMMDKLIYVHGENYIMRAADAVMLNNLEDYEYAASLSGVGAKAHFVSASEGCGIDTDYFNSPARLMQRDSIRAELGYADDDIVIGFMGRLEWEKGFRELIIAASILRADHMDEPIHFLLIGNGTDEKEIASMTSKYGVSDMFKFVGYQRDVRRYFSALDISVLPSYREGLPTVLLQAMALGIASIASNVRGSRELIQHNTSGLIAGPHDPDSLADALYRLISDPALRLSLAQKAEKRIQLNYAQEQLLPKTLGIIESTARENFI